MRLTAIEHYAPQRKVTRAETVDLFRHYSRSYHPDPAALEEVCQIADKLLDRAKFQQCMVRAEGEPFYRNFIDMTKAMIDKSGVDPKEIGAVVYCGVGRGYREPATAHQMSAHLGLKKAEPWDILDACNGWSRTARVVESLLRNNAYKHALVLSLEFNRSPLLGASPDKTFGDFHRAYSIRNMKELEWRVWAGTVGEAGTATIWSKDDSKQWYFDYDCECSEFEDCAFTLKNHREYDLHPMALDDEHGGEEFFYAFGKRIGESIKGHMPPLLKKVKPWLDEASVVVAHSLSTAVYEWIFNEVGVHQKAVYPFNKYGNCASSGVPIGVNMAIKEGRMKRGDRVILAPTGSGSSAGVISFIY
jgi:3-oxoacyl-[acyl-carrier-protein] synthase III